MHVVCDMQGSVCMLCVICKVVCACVCDMQGSVCMCV